MPRDTYGLLNPAASALGFVDIYQPNVMGRSNAEYLGLGGWTDGALAATGVFATVPIAVNIGETFSKVSIIVGATAEATGTHAIAALYSGVAAPLLLKQSADVTGAAAIAASAVFSFTLASNYVVTEADAPNGFIYAGVAVTATTVPTAAVASTPAAIGYQWQTTGPKFMSATHDTGVGATAPATMGAQTAKAVAPIIILT